MRTDYRSPTPVALTFDDGPDPIWTPLVLDALASVGARATFFVVAPLATRYASLISSMRESGHDVAFHCAEHVRHDAMTRREIEADVKSGLLALGRPVRYWRTPWGLITPATEEEAIKHRLVGWTADTEDWQFSGASMTLTAAVYTQVGGLDPLTALEDENLEKVLRHHDVPIHRLLSLRVTTSPRLVGRATRGLSNDLANIARSLREEREQG